MNNNDTRSDAIYRFTSDDVAGALASLRAHGFAIIEGMLPATVVETLREAVHEACDSYAALEQSDVPIEERSNQYCMTFIEHSTKALALLEHQPYLDYITSEHAREDLCFHRSACIRRSPGDDGIAWHRDTSPLADDEPSQIANDVLNRPAHQYEKRGGWFYLTGSRPEHGGLWVIPGSHKADYELPAGFEAVNGRKSFKRVGAADGWCHDLDVPGAIPVITEPGDLIIFTTETFHAAGPNLIEQDRLSCGIGFRPRSAHIEAPWELPAPAQALAARIPDAFKSFMDGYTSFDGSWRAEGLVSS